MSGAEGSAPASARRLSLIGRLGAILCWAYAGVLCIFWATLWLGGDRWWVATLLLFGPRWLGLLPLPALILIPVFTRWRFFWPLLAGLLIELFAVLGLRVPVHRLWTSPDPGAFKMRVMTLNTHGSADAGALADVIAREQPDVILLQECPARLEAVVAPTYSSIARSDGYVVASRYPVQWQQHLVNADAQLPMGEEEFGGRFTLHAPPGDIELFNLHLTSPHLGFDAFTDRDGGASTVITGNSRQRLLESQSVRDGAVKFPSVVIAGDFNTPTESAIFGTWSGFRDGFREAGIGFGFTYYTRRLQLRIDHILVPPNWRVVRAWVGPDVKAAHRPVFADVEWRAR